MVRAHEDGSDHIRPEHIVKDPRGIAMSILRGDPTGAYPYLRPMVLESGGTFCSVDETQIRAARQMLADYEGIDCCFSASTALSGLIKSARAGLIEPDECVLVNLTGRDRPFSGEGSRAEWLERTADNDWSPIRDKTGVKTSQQAEGSTAP